MKFLKPLLGVVFSSVMALSAYAQQAPITLHGASQFGDDHAFTKAMVKFEELVKKILRQAGQFCTAQKQRIGSRKRLLRLHEPRQSR